MKKSVLLMGAALVLCTSLFAEDAASIVKKSVTAPRPLFSQCQVSVELIDKNGATEKRMVNQFGNYKQNVTNTVFDFRSPASVKDTRLLQTEKANGADDKWIYLPSLKQTRRIATAERKKEFVGTDFSYNDMTLRKAEDDENTMLDENATVKAGSKTYNVWKIKSIPIANTNVEYAYRIQYIDKESGLPVYTEYFDRSNKVTKKNTIEALEKVQGATGISYWFRRGQLMENCETGHKTRLYVVNFVFDKQIADSYFTQNWLNTGK